MKIAKLSVTPETIDDVLASIVSTESPKQLMVNRKSIKKELLAQLAGFKKGIKKGAPQRFVLVGCHNMQLLVENDPRIEDCFEIFNTKAELEARFFGKDNKHIWARYEFPKPVSPETQLRYESFFSGFLHYYDTELRNGMSDHTIYCRWQKKLDKATKINQDVVTVYLDPAPLRHKLNPIPGTKRSSKTPDEYVNLMNKKNEEIRKTIFNPAWNPPGSITGFRSDPPSPQGPPPPEAAS